MIATLDIIMQQLRWKEFFTDFTFPYGFYAPEEYSPWLQEAGFTDLCLELKPKVMVHKTRERFTGWLRTTWLHYLERIPSSLQEEFIETVVDAYTGVTTAGDTGLVTTTMQRLEYMALRPEHS